MQDPLATKILRGEVKPGDHVTVDEGPDGAIRFEVGKAPAEGAAPPVPPARAGGRGARAGGKGSMLN